MSEIEVSEVKKRKESIRSKLSLCIDPMAVLVGSFVLMYITLGTVQSFGVIYSELLDQFQSGKGETTWIASLSSGLMLAFGPVAGILEKKFGCRVIAITGCITITVGMLSSAFVSSLYLLYLTYGITCGIGFCLSHLAPNVIIPLYFDKRRSLAMSLTSAGGSVGTIVTPLLSTWWLEEYQWRGTFILMACLSLQGIVFGMALRKRKIVNNEKTDTGNETNPRDKPSLIGDIKHIFHVRFCLFAISGFFVSMAYFIPYVMTPDLAKERGVDDKEAALIITVAGISGLVGRILMGYVADIPSVNRCILNGIALILGGVATISCAFIFHYGLFLVYSVCLGIFTGTFAFIQSVITADLCGTDQLSLAFGFLILFQGIAVIIGPPVAGWIADATGSYNESFYYGGSLFILGGILSLMIRLLDRCRS